MADLPELWNHQKVAVQRASLSESFGFFFDVGTGKTRALLETLRRKYALHSRVIPTLILAPPITLSNWKKEILKYTKIPEAQILLLEGTGAKKAQQLERFANKNIVITNYESLLNEDIFEALKKRLDGETCLVLDESHYIKNPTSKRTKKVLQLSDLCKYRFCLSGTPVLNNAEDVWSQAYVLDRGERFEKKFHYFKLKYFEDKNAGMPKSKYWPNWVIRPSMFPIFQRQLEEISMSVKKSDCLDLPPFIKTEIEVPLSAEQKHHYESVKKDFITYVADAACVASIAIVKALRMQEIASGFMSLDNDEKHRFKENPRMDALKELVDLHVDNHKIIIWSCFKENHLQIGKMLEEKKIGYVQLTGEESEKEKFANIESFESDPKIRVCIGSQAVGIGFNMVSSSMSIYYSRNFNLGHDVQSEARNYRGGSERHEAVYRIDLVAPDSLDRHVLQALSEKKSLSAKLIKDFVDTEQSS